MGHCARKLLDKRKESSRERMFYMELALNSFLKEPLFAGLSAYAELRNKPLGFVDIGARGGVHPMVNPVAGVTAVLGFEPDEVECARISAELAAGSPWAANSVEPVALAASEGDAFLHLLTEPSAHSLRGPNPKFTYRYNMVLLEQVGQLPLRTVSLDSILFGPRAREDHWGEFLMLDTQGTECEILQGSQRTLSERTVAVVSEVEFFQVYEGQSLFSEVELFLRERGFSFYGFTTVGHRSRKLLDKRKEIGRERMFYADAVFFKDPLSGGSKFDGGSQRAQQVLFVCALLLGYYDFALELALETWATGKEATSVKQLAHHLASLPPAQAHGDALALAQRVSDKPELANIEGGRFVDARRSMCDYYDVSGDSRSLGL